ncbi:MULTISPECIES: RNA polymerase sigma factor [Bacillota]|jgi:RNA polymerase sporulation-specific sigma factor|uniref:Sigma-70 family RNA polymerase sigma factor n=2 Tax=Amedibacillus TaxID=2749846 RepID=A0A7G9GNH8_9FIRM|nr:MULTISPECIES: sigma-70 family RNA polymerase sigma factor [Bacillota]QNM12360.1 sigma-70 family RNA polymerase sigma factor [[Eubacterium] hominis]MCH4284287.1 sigma-70 family RNA polymerase sigma factor [Amedibacillus hominis]RGB57462.1 sigma-70 family RNA polymerase sigma factor [Absiella sp. AM22-9]RGB62431.1 sigma-70 family RNA polymerase sigma factor [Absiella sp. AM10-20]RGB63686.1 sigma-70 family RNA polymerase sigma factor [Absiella sp. AM09-45]
MQIEELNDNELIYMIRQRNEKAFAFLVNKYQVEIRRWLRHILRTYPRYQDQEDFYQIALLKLHESIDDYKADQSSFHNYYFKVLKHTTVDMIRSMNTYSRRQDKYMVSLDMHIQEGETNYRLMDMIVDEIPAEEDEQEEHIKENVLYTQKRLNPLEVDILSLRTLGYSYDQIAEKLNIPKKKVDNTLCKIRKRKKRRYVD